MANATRQRKQNQDRCYSRRHLSMAAEGYYQNLLLITNQGKRPFWTDTRRDSWEYGVDRKTIAAVFSELEKAGFIEAIDPPGLRDAAGRMRSRRFRVLTHDDWANRYQGSCRFASEGYDDAPARYTREGRTDKRKRNTFHRADNIHMDDSSRVEVLDMDRAEVFHHRSEEVIQEKSKTSSAEQTFQKTEPSIASVPPHMARANVIFQPAPMTDRKLVAIAQAYIRQRLSVSKGKTKIAVWSIVNHMREYCHTSSHAEQVAASAMLDFPESTFQYSGPQAVKPAKTG